MKWTKTVHECPPDRGGAMLGEHANHQLPQKVEEGLLLPADLHPQPPGVDGSHTETPGVDAKPPLANPVGYPKIERT